MFFGWGGFLAAVVFSFLFSLGVRRVRFSFCARLWFAFFLRRVACFRRRLPVSSSRRSGVGSLFWWFGGFRSWFASFLWRRPWRRSGGLFRCALCRWSGSVVSPGCCLCAPGCLPRVGGPVSVSLLLPFLGGRSRGAFCGAVVWSLVCLCRFCGACWWRGGVLRLFVLLVCWLRRFRRVRPVLSFVRVRSGRLPLCVRGLSVRLGGSCSGVAVSSPSPFVAAALFGAVLAFLVGRGFLLFAPVSFVSWPFLLFFSLPSPCAPLGCGVVPVVRFAFSAVLCYLCGVLWSWSGALFFSFAVTHSVTI